MDSSPFLHALLEHSVPLGTIVALLLCGLGVPLPEEAIFLTAGYIGWQQHGNIWVLIVAGLIGILLGDSIPFWLGRRYGLGLLQRPYFARLISAKSIEKTRLFFQKHGSHAVFIARFLAGVRTPTFFMTGAMGVKYHRFFFWDLLGAMISCPVSIWLAYHFGQDAVEKLKEFKVAVFVVLGLASIYIVWRAWQHFKQGGGDAPVPPPPAVTTGSAPPPEKTAHKLECGEVVK